MRGHIRKRGRNSWYLVVEAARDPRTGRRRQVTRTVRGTKREAESELARLVAGVQDGSPVRHEPLTVGAYFDRWLREYAASNVQPSTYRRYADLLRLHAVPGVGSLRLTRLRPLDIQGLYSAALAKGLSPRTVAHLHRVVYEALKHAVRWELLERNPADAVKPPRPERFRPPVLEPGDVSRLLEAADACGCGSIARLAVFTGLRAGELLALRWEDVDLDRGVLAVRRSKSHAGVRSVALSPGAVRLLAEHRKAQLEARLAAGGSYVDPGLVFATSVGTPVRNLRRSWARVKRMTGLNVRFHDLRHTHATLLLRQNVHPKVVAERLGHSRVELTLNTYSHVLPGLQAEAAAKIDAVLVSNSLAIDEGTQPNVAAH